METIISITSFVVACLAVVVVSHRAIEGRWPWQAPMLPGTRWAIKGGPTVEVLEVADYHGRVAVEYPGAKVQRISESALRRCAKQVIPSARDMGVKP